MSTARRAHGMAAARRHRRRCAARSSRQRTPVGMRSPSGATAHRRAASCTSMTAPRASTRITHCEELIATPINLGSSELVSINDLVSIVESVAGVTLTALRPAAPKGVGGRNSDNTMIKRILKWEPSTSLKEGISENISLDRAAVQRPQGRQAHGQLRGHVARMRPGAGMRLSSGPCPTAWPLPEDGSISPSCRV